MSLIWRCHHYQWRAANFDHGLHVAVRVLYCGTPSMTQNICWYISLFLYSLRIWHSHCDTCCQVFSTGTITICSNDLGLLRVGFNPPTFNKYSSHLLARVFEFTFMSFIGLNTTNLVNMILSYVHHKLVCGTKMA